jgi:hypothetical protein
MQLANVAVAIIVTVDLNPQFNKGIGVGTAVEQIGLNASHRTILKL